MSRDRVDEAWVVLTFLLGWVAWLPVLAAALGLVAAAPPVFVALGLAMPGVAALVCELGGPRPREDVLRWIADALDPRADLRWYVVALGLPAALGVVALCCDLLATGRVPYPEEVVGLGLWFGPDASLPGSVLGGLVLVGLVGELGWRGWLLPRLQARLTAFDAAAVVGLLQLAFRVPTAWFDPAWASTLPAIVLALGVVPSSIIAAWLHNSSGGRVPVVALFVVGASLWTTSPLAAGPMGVVYVLGLCVLALVVVRFQGAEDLAPTPRVELAG